MSKHFYFSFPRINNANWTRNYKNFLISLFFLKHSNFFNLIILQTYVCLNICTNTCTLYTFDKHSIEDYGIQTLVFIQAVKILSHPWRYSYKNRICYITNLKQIVWFLNQAIIILYICDRVLQSIYLQCGYTSREKREILQQQDNRLPICKLKTAVYQLEFQFHVKTNIVLTHV